MDEIFDAIPRPVVALCERLREKGRRGWVVGGCVRDLLRGARAKDWDIATDARPEEVQRFFRRVIPTGIQHGTVTVLVDGVGYEVTTLRGEGAYGDGRHPDQVVFLDDITQDLARRDFTINAIALEPLERHVVDPFGGQRDLEARTLRAVGTPAQRFQEDGLRILRGARFAATLQCTIDGATLAAMGDPQSLDTLRRVSAERIHDEWMKAMRAEAPSIAFSIMEETGVIDICCPELRPTVGCMQPCGIDVWSHSLRAVDRAPSDCVLRIAALFHDIAKPATRHEEAGAITFPEHDRLGSEMVEAIMRRLKFSNDDRQRVVDLVRRHVIGYAPTWTDAEVRRWLRLVTKKRLDDQLTLAVANAEARGDDAAVALAELAELRERAFTLLQAGAVLSPGDLALRGKDLIVALELTPGPIVGELLAELVEVAIDDPSANDKQALLAHARRLLAARSEERRG